MTFSENLASHDPQKIQKALFTLLDTLTPDDVLILDREFEALKTEEKHGFYAQFEASTESRPQRSPKLLERWTHFLWIRLELNYLVNQKAALNHISPLKDSLNSVNQAIQQHAEQGASIEDSIAIIRQMSLQIVGTEHPTDPLSQPAKDTLTQIALTMDEKNPSEDKITQLLTDLVNVDTIPHARRSVTEEVNRNIRMTLDRLYDNVPYLIDAIANAYKKHYGEASYLLHEQAIFDAIEGGKEIDGVITPPLLRDASWPGLDADGNDNVTAAAMRDCIRLYRIRVAEKHIGALNTSVVETAKTIERQLRQTLTHCFSDLLRDVRKSSNPNINEMLDKLIDAQEQASIYLSDRQYPALLTHCLMVESDLKSQWPQHEKLHTLFMTAEALAQLAQFSGLYRSEVQGELKDHQGAIQQFQKIFIDYRDTIRVNGDAIFIKTSTQVEIPISKHVIDHYQGLVETQKDFLKAYPELYKQLRYFGIQLHCYGMTYGVGHIRQDSSVFGEVWDAIFTELMFNQQLSTSSILQSLNTRHYTALTADERVTLHKQLLDGSDESNQLLKAIFHQHKYRKHASKHPQLPLMDSELKRLQLAIEHADMIENIIISNSQSAANILEVESLLAIFPEKPHQIIPTIVPLLETRQDLERYESILLGYIKTKIQQSLETAFDGTPSPLSTLFPTKDAIKTQIQTMGRGDFSAFLQTHPTLRPYLKNITIEIMVGFSDTDRVSGLPALITVQQTQEYFIQLSNDFGVRPKLYYGPGGDLNRGGLKRRDEKATLQGKARDVLNTDTSTQWYRETQFNRAYDLIANPSKRMEITHMPQDMQDWLETFSSESTSFYEHLHDAENGLGKLLGYLLGQTEHWIVTMLNSSSRATQRGTSDYLGDRTASVQKEGERPASYIRIDKLRAISAMFMQEMLRENLDFLAPSYGMRKIGLERACLLYDRSQTFRDLVIKESIGAAKRDLSFSAYALFADHPELSPLTLNQTERQQWANECRKDYPSLLKEMDFIALSKNPANKYALLVMLSKLFAYIQVECDETVDFLSTMNRFIHPTHSKDKTSLLAHFPMCDAQIKELNRSGEPLFYLLARQCQHVAQGENLDEKLPGLNHDGILPEGELSGIGSLLGNCGAGIIAANTSQTGYHEEVYLDYKANTQRPGFERAQREAADIGRTVELLRPKGKSCFRFFDTTTEQAIQQLESLLAERKFTTP